MTASTPDKSTTQKPPKRIGSLKTSADILKFMRRCLREAAREGGSGGTAQYRLVVMASVLLKGLETVDLEARIKKLEEGARTK